METNVLLFDSRGEKVETGKKKKPVRFYEPKRMSGSGTRWVGGRPQIPYADGFEKPSTHEWALTCEKMLASDSKISSAAMQLQNNMLSATWYIEPASDTFEAQRNADFVRDAFGLEGHCCHLRSGSFEQEIRKLARYPLVGFQVVEEVWACSDGFVWLSELGDIDPASIEKWERDDQTGALKYIVQRMIWGDTTADSCKTKLPSTKALICTLGQIGSNVEGIGLLSACYPWFRLKQSLIDAMANGVPQWANPLPIFRVNRDALQSEGYGLDEQQNLLNTAEEFANAFVDGRAGYLISPAGIDPDLFSGSSFDPNKIILAIESCNKEISSAFLANFMELGLGQEGSRSIGEIHWNSYKASIANYLDLIASAFNGPCRPGGGTISRLLQANFYGHGIDVPLSELPRLQHRGVEVDSLREALGILPSLVAGGLLTPNGEIEDKIRRAIGVNGESPERPWNQRLQEIGSAGSNSILRDSEGGRPKNPEVTRGNVVID